VKGHLALMTRLSSVNSKIPQLSEIQLRARDVLLEKIESKEYQLVDNPCPTCDSSHKDILIAQVDRYALPVTTKLCSLCGLLRTDPIMTEDSYQDFYQHHYRSLYSGSEIATDLFFADQFRRGNKLHKFLSQEVSLQGKTILEVGVGAGGILLALCQSGAIGIGCDFGDAYLAHAISKGLDVRSGGLAQFPDNAADVIVYSHVLEHISNLDGELTEVRRVLKNDGVLLINVPGIFSIHRDYAGDILQYLQNAHLFHFTKGSLNRLLRLNGFREVAANQRVVGIYSQSTDELGGSRLASTNYRLLITYLYLCNFARPLLRIPHLIYPFVVNRRK
jgi:SAM-dependent methyltransferase